MAIGQLVGTCLALVTISSAPMPARAGEVLYNGIELPDDWPPARTLEELRSGTPMEVPYQKSPPALIPIDVERQLFVDDFLVESTTLERVFHKPVLGRAVQQLLHHAAGAARGDNARLRGPEGQKRVPRWRPLWPPSLAE
jgi:hypothetical protein